MLSSISCFGHDALTKQWKRNQEIMYCHLNPLVPDSLPRDVIIGVCQTSPLLSNTAPEHTPIFFAFAHSYSQGIRIKHKVYRLRVQIWTMPTRKLSCVCSKLGVTLVQERTFCMNIWGPGGSLLTMEEQVMVDRTDLGKWWQAVHMPFFSVEWLSQRHLNYDMFNQVVPADPAVRGVFLFSSVLQQWVNEESHTLYQNLDLD